MAIPAEITVKEGKLPASPGVYFMKDAQGKLLYIGKAASLRTRVSSYFTRPADARIALMVTKIRNIDYVQTPTSVEALMLESSLIKKHQPPYNVMEKDDKSYVHLAFTKEPYPRPILIRGHELARMPKKQFLKTYGPFHSSAAVRASLDALRRSFPWTNCQPGKKRPCFYHHIGLCPGVCVGEISPKDYQKIIKQLMRFFDGGRIEVVGEMQRAMKAAAKNHEYEEAADLRDRLYALDHIRDEALLKRETPGIGGFIDIFGRIEGYDISNISGQDAVGSMVVFVDGEAKKKWYKKFLIKTVQGSNDTAMMEEVLLRRFAHVQDASRQNGDIPRAKARGVSSFGGDEWAKPDLLLIDGGVGQINAVKRALEASGVKIPLIGLAKGFDRKQDELVYDKGDIELGRLITAFKPLLQRVRDEAHRFAVGYHRKRRSARFIPKE